MLDLHAHSRRPVVLAALLGTLPALAAPEIELASVEAASVVLGTRDAFVERLSPFDRAARLKSGDDVSEAQYLAFARQAPREWTSAERARIEAALESMGPALSALVPELEQPILLIKTTGAEEGGAAGYTRANAVVLPSLPESDLALQRTLAHEIFHVVSRNEPVLRRALYAAIGFHYCGEVELPETLAARKITNPDAPVNDHCIRVRIGSAEAWSVPILLSREARYDPAAGVELLGYLTLSMLIVDRTAGADAARPILRGGEPVLVPIDRVAGFFEQIGRNTQYIIHPEEILASNFALLVLGEVDVPSPEVLERMRRILTAAVERGASGAPSPEMQRRAIELVKLQERPLKEAAMLSGASVGALRVATHRALATLRRTLGTRR